MSSLVVSSLRVMGAPRGKLAEFEPNKNRRAPRGQASSHGLDDSGRRQIIKNRVAAPVRAATWNRAAACEPKPKRAIFLEARECLTKRKRFCFFGTDRPRKKNSRGAVCEKRRGARVNSDGSLD